MKNLYLKSYLIVVLLFVIQLGYAQNVLNESPNGTKIQSYLDQKKSDYNLLDLDIQDLYVTNEFFSKTSEIKALVKQSYFNGKNYLIEAELDFKPIYFEHHKAIKKDQRRRIIPCNIPLNSSYSFLHLLLPLFFYYTFQSFILTIYLFLTIK